MAHVKKIPAPKIFELLNVPFDNNTLFGMMDNASQTVWYPIAGKYHDIAMEKLAQIAPEVAADPLTVKTAQKFTSRAFGGRSESIQFSVDDLHQILSLQHYLQPEREERKKLAIEQGLQALSLPPVIPPEQLKEQLPALLASMKKTIAQQNKKGGRLN